MNWLTIAGVLALLYMLAEIFLYMWKEVFEKTVPRELAWFFRFASWIWEPRTWGCGHCGLSSRLADFHGTEYASWGSAAGYEQLELLAVDRPGFIESCGGSSSLMILCEHCWSSLSPVERWEIYEQFLKMHPRADDSFMPIYHATMAGK